MRHGVRLRSALRRPGVRRHALRLPLRIRNRLRARLTQPVRQGGRLLPTVPALWRVHQ
ncbi:hypothetical protein SXIM_09880 [Streptomyces xiamenensis]|uniref:Uncharacterized protein n=1 Tax=Streptomyces xiamenensis TaxID=408015 RepID=A0A0F7FS44_9ACTN|nr:hypothetical protein SXIM_09880 [Streptomyces xiamenensis]